MSNSFLIHLPTLKAVSLMAPKQDIRYYLNGVLIETGPSATHYVATNGAALIAARNHETCEQTVDLIIPLDFVKSLKPFSKSVEYVSCEIGKQNGQVYELTIKHGGGALTFDSIDAKFPDWRKVMPKALPIQPATYDPTYLAIFQKIAQALGADKGIVIVRQAGNAAALVDIGRGDDYIGVIMPMLAEPLKIAAPNWISAERKQPAPKLSIAA